MSPCRKLGSDSYFPRCNAAQAKGEKAASGLFPPSVPKLLKEQRQQPAATFLQDSPRKLRAVMMSRSSWTMFNNVPHSPALGS